MHLHELPWHQGKIFSDNVLLEESALQNFHLKPASKPLLFEPLDQKIDICLVIISKSPKLQIAQLVSVFNCRQFIFDASNSWWKINQWQKECKEVHLNVHSTPSDGAFIFDIGM